jgi:hypothetical protein
VRRPVEVRDLKFVPLLGDRGNATERRGGASEFEDWPSEADPIRLAVLPLIQHVFAVTADGSVERGKALDVVLTAVEKVRAALRPQPRLQ